MNYIYDIELGIIIYPIIALILTIPYMLYQYRKYGSVNILRTIIIYSLIFYLLCMYLLVIFPLPKTSTILKSYKEMINYKPFLFIKDFIKENPLVLNDKTTYIKCIKHNTFYVPLFNILMFIPLGIYLRYYYKCSLKKTFLIGLSISMFFELTQLSGLYFIYDNPYRFCDIDDLIQNTTGTVLGYILFRTFKNILPDREEIDRKSYQKGINVSQIRYILSLSIDFLIILIISFNYKTYYFIKLIITIILYFSILPQIRERTIGSSILRYNITYQKHKRIKYILRSILLYLYYFGTLTLFIYTSEYFNDTLLGLILMLSNTFMMIINILSIIVLTIINKKTLYDRILKTEYVSTIKTKENISIQNKTDIF